MRRNALLLTSATAALLYAAGVHAQGAPEPEPRPSRISPVDPRLVSPPVPMVVPRPGPAAPVRPEERYPAVTTAQMVEGARLCMAAVSPRDEVQPQLLLRDGWSWTPSRQMSYSGGSYEIVRYFKNGRAIELSDYGFMVICQAAGRIDSLDQFDQFRSALIEALGARPIGDIARLAPLAEQTLNSRPDMPLADVLIVGDYRLEVFARDETIRPPRVPVEQTVHTIVISSSALPLEYQSPGQGTPP